MSETRTFETLEEYALHIAGRAQTIAAQCVVNPDKAGVSLLALCSEATRIVESAKMNREQAGVDELNLASLPAPSELTEWQDGERPDYRP